MARTAAGFGLLLWAGAALIASRLRWFSRPSLAARLRPHVLVSSGRAEPATRLPTLNRPGAVLELFDQLATRLATLARLDDPVSDRLARIHAPLDRAGFRLRQLGWMLVAFAAAAVLSTVLPLGTPAAFISVLTAPAVAGLIVEQRLTAASRRWQRRLQRELPVVAEQLAMLVAAGYSLGAALDRLARRGRGRVALDLNRVCSRIGQGLSETDAIAEWAVLSDVALLDRLARLLARASHTPDLGRLLSAEARSIRRQLRREVVSDAERRAQMVWIPVTVAALVPGVIFLALPFLQALRTFSAP